MLVRKSPRPVWCRPGVGDMNRAPPAEACVVSAGGVLYVCVGVSSWVAYIFHTANAVY